MFRVAYCGMGGNRYLAERIASLFDDDMVLVCITEWEAGDCPHVEYVKWNAKTYIDVLEECDAAIAPQREDQPFKSIVKLIPYGQAGLPVVCSALDSYCEFAKNVRDGKPTLYVASDDKNFVSVLKKIKTDMKYAQELGANLQVSIEETCSPEVILKQWEDVIEKAMRGDCINIVAIVPVCNKAEYTMSMLNSMEKALLETKTKILMTVKLIISASDVEHDLPFEFKQLSVVKIHSKNTSFTDLVNEGIRDSIYDYMIILNNDVIFTYDFFTRWLKEKDKFDIACPISNCDMAWRHFGPLDVRDGRIPLFPGRKKEEYIKENPNFENIVANERWHMESCLIGEVDWVAFYCAIIREKVIKKVGLLDPRMQMVFSDEDYCKRAKEAGFSIGIIDANLFHYGAVTRRSDEAKDFEGFHNTDYIDTFNFYAKHKMYNRRHILMYSGEAWEDWTNMKVDSEGMGGSETCEAELSRHLSGFGHMVAHVAQPDKTRTSNLTEVYMRKDKVPDQRIHDMISVASNFICIRKADYLSALLDTPRSFDNMTPILWSHDLGFNIFRTAPWKKISYGTCCVNLSPFHKQLWRDNGYTGRIEIIPDGIESSRFVMGGEKISFERAGAVKFIYSSSPDRGLDVLLDMWDKIDEICVGVTGQHAQLDIYYGDFNLTKMDPSKKRWMNKLKEKIASNENMIYHGRVGQLELATAFKSAHVWLYPTYFYETFCLTAVQAQLSECEVITTNRGALCTTVHDLCYKSGEDIGSVYVAERMLEDLSYALKNYNLRNSHRKTIALDIASLYDWKVVVNKYWLPLLEELGR